MLDILGTVNLPASKGFQRTASVPFNSSDPKVTKWLG
ncbi:hypothetical protein N836_11975 [Leptolyngbya sp. Heron Island J]|nr:hypothetical protein N836_11975 [Leptolyngbya sp. Heron Island J]